MKSGHRVICRFNNLLSVLSVIDITVSSPYIQGVWGPGDYCNTDVLRHEQMTIAD